MIQDSTIFSLIKKEDERQRKGIELIASENYVSDQVMAAMGSCLTNKYGRLHASSVHPDAYGFASIRGDVAHV